MSLTFLNPLFLFGLAACVLPVLIHRLTRRKGILKRFSAVRLILRSQQVMARPQRLKHLLLLLLRILAVASLVLLAARPVFTTRGVLTQGSGNTHIVILDNSLGMSYRDGSSERFITARKAAKELIGALQGDFSVIPTASLPGGGPLEKSELRRINSEEAAVAVDSVPISFGRGDPGRALSLVFSYLRDLRKPGEIFVISDMARTDWDRLRPGEWEVIPADVGMTLVRVGNAGTGPNFAVEEVQGIEGDPVVGTSVALEVLVRNFSDRAASTTVRLHLAGSKADQKQVEVNAGGKETVSFTLSFDKPGWIDGEVRLAEDSLAPDNAFYFPIRVREKMKVLVVDGDPRASLRASESYYLAHALNPGGSEKTPFLASVIPEEELTNIDLKPYEAVCLLNVSRFQASKLASFLESGKSVLIFLGNRVDPEVYNRFPLLPWRLGELKSVSEIKPARIGEIRLNREGLKPVSDTGTKSLRSAAFYRYFKVEGSTGHLLTLDNRDPLLVETEQGRGRLSLFVSSADLDWNDLPLKASYLPLIQGLLKAAPDPGPLGVRVGDPFPEKGRPVQVLTPKDFPPGGPGIYQFSSASGERRRGLNVPLEESDPTRLTDAEIGKKFENVKVRIIDYQEGLLTASRGKRRELWPFLLAFLLAVLAAEMAVANRI
jgi:hypothetical protein